MDDFQNDDSITDTKALIDQLRIQAMVQTDYFDKSLHDVLVAAADWIEAAQQEKNILYQSHNGGD